MDFHILTSQADQVFHLIQRWELEASKFEWKEVSGSLSGKPVSRLTYIGTDFYFEFDNASKSFHSEFSPGTQKVTEWKTTGTWMEQFDLVKTWLVNLQREMQSSDFWSEISKEAQVLESAASADSYNVPFTAEEKKYILNGLGEIKQYLLTAHRLDPELVESRLNYLIEASERVGRKDWLNLLVSVLVGIVISAALPPDTTRELFRFVGTVLRQVIQSPLLLT